MTLLVSVESWRASLLECARINKQVQELKCSNSLGAIKLNQLEFQVQTLQKQLAEMNEQAAATAKEISDITTVDLHELPRLHRTFSRGRIKSSEANKTTNNINDYDNQKKKKRPASQKDDSTTTSARKKRKRSHSQSSPLPLSVFQQA